ncbi:MAG: sigma-E factor negative regulatory protein [Wenzhouxiangella sp.]
MTETNREHLSCLMDGELERDARTFLLRRLSNDDDLTGRWRRYHMVRACMQGEMETGTDLAERVSAALTAEPEWQARSTAAAWLKPLGGVAIAASVAVVALVGINSSLLERGQPAPLVEQPGFVSQPSPIDWSFAQPLVPVSFSETTAADRQRISGYVLRHNQAAGSVGFVSYVPIVVGSRTPPVATADADGPVTRTPQP